MTTPNTRRQRLVARLTAAGYVVTDFGLSRAVAFVKGETVAMVGKRGGLTVLETGGEKPRRFTGREARWRI